MKPNLCEAPVCALTVSAKVESASVMKGIVGATGMLCFFPGFSAPYQAMVCSLPWSKLSFFVFSAELCEKNRLTGAVDRDLDTGLDLRVWKGGFRK